MTKVGKALLPNYGNGSQVTEAARANGTLREVSAKIRAVLAKISTHNLRLLIRKTQAGHKFDQGRVVQGVYIPLPTMCAEYQARKREMKLKENSDVER